jgi:hypothetical protein
MKIRQSFVLAVASILLISPSQEARSDAPPMPKKLRCEFESYASGEATQNASRITAQIKQGPGIDPLTFSSLDPVKGTAQFIGNAGASNVSFIATAFTWSFIEVTDAGNVNVTQIFLWNEPNADLGTYRAVHSRHSSMMGAIIASQHYGRCKALY